jgi:hypothetical protein
VAGVDPFAMNSSPAFPARSEYGAFLKAALGYLVVAALVFGPTLWAHSGWILSFAEGDLAKSLYYLRSFSTKWLGKGVIPVWNPHTFCGTHFLAYPEACLFYPPNILHLLLPDSWAFNSNFIFHFWLAAISTWCLCRYFGLGMRAAFVAGLVYMMCGANMPRLHAGHLLQVQAAAWVPLLLLSVEKVLSGRQRWLAWGSLFYASFIMTGRPEYLLFDSSILVVYSWCRVIAARRIGQLVRVAMMLLIGIMLACVQLLPTYQMAKENAHAHISRLAASSFSLPPQGLLTFLLPKFLGDEPSVPYWGSGYPWEMNAYIGIVPIILVILAFVVPFHREQTAPLTGVWNLVWPLSLSGGLALVLSLGRHTPLFDVLYSNVPGFDHFRGWCKFLSPFSLAAGILAGIGFETSLERPPGDGSISIRPIVAPTILIGFACWEIPNLLAAEHGAVLRAWITRMLSAIDAYPILPKSVYQRDDVVALVTGHLFDQAARSTAILVTFVVLVCLVSKIPAARGQWLSALVVVIALDLIAVNRPFVSAFDPGSMRVQSALSREPGVKDPARRVYITNATISADVGMHDDFLSVLGYESTYPACLARLIDAVNRRPSHGYTSAPVLRDIERAAPVMAIGATYDWGKFAPVRTYAARARLFHQWRTFPTEADLESRMRADGWEPSTELLLVGAPEAKATPAVDTTSDRVRISSESPDSLQLETAATGLRCLYLADTLVDGWHAYIDDREVPIWRANIAFRAIFVPGGTHRISFRFVSPGLFAGLCITLAGVLCVLGVLCRPDRREDPRSLR